MTAHRGLDLIKQMNSVVVAPNSLAIWSLGQMGVVLKGSNQKIIYVDPILSDVVTIKFPDQVGLMDRAFPPPLQPEEVSNADYVFCTHEHLDHTDPLTLGPLAKASPQAKFVISGWAHDALDEAGISRERRVVPMPRQTLELGGITLRAIPAAHYKMEEDAERGYRWMSLLIDWGDVRFFHSGDTLLYPGYFEAVRALPKADIGLIAANGRNAMREAKDILGNMLPSEAVWMAAELGWDVLLGGHNDLFTYNTLPAGELFTAAHAQDSMMKVHVLKPGELYYYIR